jgi:hypothetical protein
MALDQVRKFPFTILSSAEPHKVEGVEKKLKTLSVRFSRRQSGERRNRGFGPIQPDRLYYSAGPQHGENPKEWLVKDLDIPTMQSARPDDANLSCLFCGSSASLVRSAEDCRSCPSCKEGQIIQVGFWVT